MTGGHQEQEQTLNQILTEMDGFDQGTKVIVIAATNRPDTLDPALLRSGRFDRKVLIGRPTVEERVLIINYHLGNKQIDSTVNVDSFARRTSGFVGADLENIINEAALKAAKEGREIIGDKDLEYGLEKLVMGPEKKIKSLKEKEKLTVTYHELGHAVTAFFLPEADPVEKISVVSRGMALGVTWMMPQEDSHLYSKAKFLDEMVSLLGGRAAEEIFFGKEHITTGASNDFERVTTIAQNMIMKYGMDEELGQIVYQDTDKEGRTPYKTFSEDTAQKIDSKMKKLVAEAYARSLQILRDNKSLIEKMAGLLGEKEYITKEEFDEIMAHADDADAIIARMREEYAVSLAQIESMAAVHPVVDTIE
jgi:cell division protease FtsH